MRQKDDILLTFIHAKNGLKMSKLGNTADTAIVSIKWRASLKTVQSGLVIQQNR